MLWVEAVYGIPKSASGKRRERMLLGIDLPTKKPDADNVLKAVCDALNGTAYQDDKQITSTWIWKHYGEIPGLRIMVKAGEAYGIHPDRT